MSGKGIPCSFVVALLLTTASAQELVEVSELRAPLQQLDAAYGAAVAPSGLTIVVGAPRENRSGIDSGAAYVYVNVDRLWHLQQVLEPAAPLANARFGVAVAIDGDQIAVASVAEPDRGAVYVFTRSGSTWTQTARLQPATANPGDGFGSALAIDDALLAVGAPSDEMSGGGFDAGAVYAYRRSGTNWSLEQHFTRAGSQTGDAFGAAIACEVDRILVGAPGEDVVVSDAGAAYVFKLSGSNWSQEARFEGSTPTPGAQFGRAVALSDLRAAIGVPLDDQAGVDGGAVHTYRFSGGSWSSVRKLLPPAPTPFQQLGTAVAMHGANLVAGSVNDSEFAPNAGSLQAFRALGDDWLASAKLGATDAAFADLMGTSVGLFGNVIVAGVPFDDGGVDNAGSAYLFDAGCLPGIQTSLFDSARCVGVTPFDWSRPLEFPRFDPVFGSLSGVRITLRTHVEGRMRFENLANTPGTYAFSAQRQLQLLPPAGTVPFAAVSAPTSGNGSLGAFDGLFDWGGTSGVTIGELFQDDVLVVDVPAADLPLFTGTIDDPGTVTLVLSATATLQRTFSGNVVPGTPLFAASALVRIEYLFEPSGTPFCFGDGGLSPACTPCPCDNDAPPGTVGGCLNLSGTSGRLTAAGTPSTGLETLQFVMEGATPSTFGVLFSGNAQLPAMGTCPPGSGIAVPPLKGLRCVGLGIVRHGTRATGPSGATSMPWGWPNASFAAQGGFIAGQTRYFQAHYRELPTLDCFFDQNTTNGVRVLYVH